MRLPYQVLVIPYRVSGQGVEYCVLQRANPPGQVQFVAGGGEGDETPLQAAARELREELGVADAALLPLTSVCSIPTHIFSPNQRQIWGETVYVIPEYAFGAQVGTAEVQLSQEHVAFQWLPYAQAAAQLTWDSNRTALYELHCRINQPHT